MADGSDAVDAHTVRREIDCEVPGQHHDAGLGGGVCDRGTTRLPSGCRGHRHDGSPAPFDHAEREGADGDVRRGEIGVDDLAPPRRIEFADRFGASVATGKREEHRRRPERYLGAGTQRVDVLLTGAVGSDADGTATPGGDRRHHRVERSPITP